MGLERASANRSFINWRNRGYLILQNDSAGGNDIDFHATGGRLASAADVNSIIDVDQLGSIKSFYFQSGVAGKILEWAPHVLVETDYTASAYTAAEVGFNWASRPDRQTFTNKISNVRGDLLLTDYDGEKFTYKPVRVNARFSDVGSRLGGASGEETFNWPIYFTAITPTPAKVANDGFGTTASDRVVTIVGRMIQEDTSCTGDVSSYAPAIVLDCATIESLTDINGQVLGHIYAAFDSIAAKFNAIRLNLFNEPSLTQGYPSGLDFSPPNNYYLCSGASSRTAGTNDVPYY